MLVGFFDAMRAARIPVSVRELLDLVEALQAHLVFADMEQFYFLARAVLVKDERHYDKFDRAFAAYFEGLPDVERLSEALIPDEWLRLEFERQLSAEDKARLQGLGGLDKLLETFRQRLEEQQKKHAGGNKWIGTGGTSPFGSGGYHPEGIRLGEAGTRRGKAVKVWQQREYRNLDEDVEVSRRNIQLALRRLRKFARQGAAQELDIDMTIDHTAREGGLLDIQMRPERRNAVKLLLLFDIGGSMDPHVKVCQELFSACRTEFKHLEYYYFHNFIYEAVWRNNFRRMSEITPTHQLLRTYGPDWKVVFVGDAAMAPYEITQPGGSVEHWNEEAGFVWMQRFVSHFRRLVWINPYAEEHWAYSASTGLVRELVQNQMYPLTLHGLEQGMRQLAK
ncbi:vWA domain-containing protein [Stutzerimonas tarimensis]|uniref:VWA domain-containing protein n=1 Tax=Stutzerimonas tarimensis TaxID=1507735 RepID=A0ABV7T1K0_9GAMM